MDKHKCESVLKYSETAKESQDVLERVTAVMLFTLARIVIPWTQRRQ
jgi:hypothetical protein